MATFAATGALNQYSGTPPGEATPAGGSTPSSTQVIGDRPTMTGSGNYMRALDQSDGDAIANLTGAITGRGLYQDITAFITELSRVYHTQGTPADGVTFTTPTGTTTYTPQANAQIAGIMSPPALLRAVRDAINFMLLNAPA